MQVTGPMDVETRPDPTVTAGYGRLVLTKRYHGGLAAEAQGEMLTGGDPKTGTAGYVAIENVTGSLDGHAGSFQLMQWGTMAAGKPGESGTLDLRIAVVPGSGTGALLGVSGTLQIERTPEGKHTYTLDYTLPEAPFSPASGD